MAAARVGPRAHWHYRLGVVHQHARRWDAAARAYQAALARDDTRAHWHYRLGVVHQHARRWDAAARAYQAALARDDTRAHWHYRLGVVREHQPASSVYWDMRLGLVERRIGDWSAAAQAFASAVQRDPTNALFHFRLGLAQERMLEWSAAAEAYCAALELDDTHASWFMRLARVKDRLFDLASARKAYTEAIRRDPSNEKYRSSFIGFLTKLSDWKAVSQQLAEFASRCRPTVRSSSDAEPSLERNSSSLVNLLSEDISDVELVQEVIESTTSLHDTMPVDWWMCLHWKLIDRGAFTLAYKVKSIAAKLLLDLQCDPVNGNLPLVLDVAKALVYLGREGEALEYLYPATASLAGGSYRREVCGKLVADIWLLIGELDRFEEYEGCRPDPNQMQVQTSFYSLIHDKRVAVVGPADTNLENGNFIDEHDIVIRFNFLPTAARKANTVKWGARTDISYYNVSFVEFKESPVATALAGSDLRIAVLRRPSHPSRYENARTREAVRLLPAESGAVLRAAPFAVPRIVYDLLRQRPRCVDVFNIDLFTSKAGYQPGYKRPGADRGFHGFPHDFRMDFMWLKRLRELGFVRGDGAVEAILDWTPDHYLSVLDSKLGPFPPRISKGH